MNSLVWFRIESAVAFSLPPRTVRPLKRTVRGGEGWGWGALAGGQHEPALRSTGACVSVIARRKRRALPVRAIAATLEIVRVPVPHPRPLPATTMVLIAKGDENRRRGGEGSARAQP
jgi:hypothetical protein